MEFRHRYRVLTLLATGILGTAPAVAQAPTDSLPPGVTPAQVQEGKQLFGGAGLCMACHGPEAKGGLGPNLTAGKWLHGAGAYDELVSRILLGTPMSESISGQMMPPRGGGGLSDAQIRAVAAYVWSISRRKPPA